jgi:cytochrome P450
MQDYDGMIAPAAGIEPLFDPDVVQDPFDYYRHLRENDPVHEVAGTGTYLVTRREIIHDVVARPAVFSSDSNSWLYKGDGSGPAVRSRDTGYPGVLATTDPPNHARHRKVVSRMLSTANMRTLEPDFRSLMDEALADIASDGRFEWMSRVAEPLPMVMVSRILGLPDDVAPDLKRQGYASLEQIGGFVPGDRLEQLQQVTAKPHPKLAAAYAKAKEDATAYSAALIGIVARAVVDGELDDGEALGILRLMISAGGESTTSLTGTGVRILAERPDLQHRLRSAPSLIPVFVEEACRLDGPFRGHYRRVTQDVELAGKTVPAGSRLVLMWSAANRDETAFDRPEEVRLDRPNPRQHLGFGWGIHLCVGAPLARIEAKVAIEALLARTRAFRIDPAAPPLEYHPSLMVRRLVSLPLLLELAE